MFKIWKKSVLSTAVVLASGLLGACQTPQMMLPPMAPQFQVGRNPMQIFSLGAPKKRPKLGLKFSPATRRIRVSPEDLLPVGLQRTGLPVRVDLRHFDSPIVNQGDLGACTGFAIVKGLREFMLIRDRQPAFQPLSPLFLYYYERKKEGTVDEDAGALITTGMEVLQKIGVSREELWSYDPSNDNNPVTKEKFQQAPPPAAHSDARTYRVQEIKPLDTLRDIRYELAHGNPVVFGIEVFEEFYEPPQGIVPKPNPKKKSEGGHAVTAVGYDDKEKRLIVKNSWGTDWGDRGYFYLPYEYVKLGLAGEAWTAH